MPTIPASVRRPVAVLTALVFAGTVAAAIVAAAIVEATTHYQDPARVAAASTGLGQPMVSLETSKLGTEQLLAPRGW